MECIVDITFWLLLYIVPFENYAGLGDDLTFLASGDREQDPDDRPQANRWDAEQTATAMGWFVSDRPTKRKVPH